MDGKGSDASTVSAETDAERAVFDRLLERFTVLSGEPGAPDILAWYRLDKLIGGNETPRLTELAMAVHRLENALDAGRARLPKIDLMEPADIERHPGFDGVENEILTEEDIVLQVRARIERG